MTTINNLDISAFNLAELQALAQRANQLKKEMLEADAARLGAMLQDFADTVVEERAVESSDMSGWHGIKVFALPVKVDEREYTVSVTLTDVALTDTAKAEIKAKKGDAYDAHLKAVASKA